ncbi:sensor histidine kinase [Neorhizobium sp. DAR64860/K0K1]|uniref:sensor histidine kinase n=1 Tax=Neorhizobium sp. DAR64860/K0K1 TaxID=3421955 RepID=UPI003D275263
MKLKLVAVAVAALVPIVALLAYNEVSMRYQRNEEVRDQAAQAARQASSEVERIIEGLHSLLIAVSAMPSVHDLEAARCSETLTSVASKVGNVRTIFVTDPRGRAICGSTLVPEANFADRDYFKQVIETRGFVVGTYTKSRMSDAAVLPVALPVMEGDAIKAVVVTGVRLDWLQTRITERGVARGNAVTVADGEGTILARAPFPERFVGTAIPEHFRSLVRADAPGVLEVTSQDGNERVMGYRPISLPGTPLYVSAGFSRGEAFAPINRATLINIVAIVVGALLSFLAAVYIGNKFLVAPVRHIADVMERWRRGEISARTGMAARDELGEVGSTLDGLLDELDCRRRRDEAAEEERGLLARELAHRVKNGFALVQAIARQTFYRADPERFRSFSERLKALAGTYDLLLAKDAAPSSIREIVSRAVSAHADAGSSRLATEGPDLVLSPELALPLSLVIHELATNATKYGSLSQNAGMVSIEWSRDGATGVRLIWRETGGPPVEPPSKKGFGSVLIERAFPAPAGAACLTDYRPEGVVFELIFSAEALAPS